MRQQQEMRSVPIALSARKASVYIVKQRTDRRHTLSI
jgi:hypothetical protein